MRTRARIMPGPRRLRFDVPAACGAALVLALTGLAAIAPAEASPAAPGTTETHVYNTTVVECAAARGSPPTWNPSDGRVHGDAVTRAAGCPAARGGSYNLSKGLVLGNVQVSEPLGALAGSGGVNFTWTIRAQAADAAPNPSASRCPGVRSVVDYNLFGTWTNVTRILQYCYVYAIVFVTSDSEILDLTNGSVVASYGWTGANATGERLEGGVTWTNYSNPGPGHYNTTTRGFSEWTYGTRGALPDPDRFRVSLSATFSPKDQYAVVTYLDYWTECEVFGFTHTSASATFDLSGPYYRAELSGMTSW